MGSIYRDIPWMGSSVRGRVSKREVNVSVTPSPGGISISGLPLFDSEDIAYYNSEYKKGNTYLDLGCVVVTIRGLFRKNAGVTGKILLFDNMFDNLKQATIASFKFDLNSGFAAFASFPGFSLASNDHINERLQAIVMFDNLNVRESKYQPIAISVGCVCRLSPTAFPPRNRELESSSDIFQNIQSTELLKMEGVDTSTKDLIKAFENQIVKPNNTHTDIKRRQRKSYLRRLPVTKVTNLEVDYVDEVESAVKRSASCSNVERVVSSSSDFETARASTSDVPTTYLLAPRIVNPN